MGLKTKKLVALYMHRVSLPLPVMVDLESFIMESVIIESPHTGSSFVKLITF